MKLIKTQNIYSFFEQRMNSKTGNDDQILICNCHSFHNEMPCQAYKSDMYYRKLDEHRWKCTINIVSAGKPMIIVKVFNN